MKILVTGGTGFIGQYVVEDLVRNGYDVLALDRHRRKDSIVNSKVEIFLGDVTDPTTVTEAFAHVDAFIHLAAVLGTQETIMNPRPAALSNLMGGMNVLEAAAQYRIPGAYIGVGNHWMNNTYSITKTMIERFIDMYNHDRGTVVNIVRAMNAYGPRQVPAHPYGPARVRKITPSFACRALCNDPVEIYGDGNQVSDMVHVRDVARTLILAAEQAMEGRKLPTIEIGPAINNTVNEVAELIVELAGSRSKITHLPMRPGEIPNAVVKADTSTMLHVGITPSDLIPIRDGMAETVEYFREYLREKYPQAA